MIRFPIFTQLSVKNYGLLPGTGGDGIEWKFPAGLTLVAGVNGLGKTTLLNMLLRLLTGPYDLTGDGTPERFEAVLPEKPVGLSSKSLKFFSQRVADGAMAATAELSMMFAENNLKIERRLSDLSLESLEVKGKKKQLPDKKGEREEVFQGQMCDQFGVSSFVDVLLVLHHIVFFNEKRPGALWDPNAQRHILRALFLEKRVAADVAASERAVQSADSKARNISARAFNVERELADERLKDADSPTVQAELVAEQNLLNADLQTKEQLEIRISTIDQERRIARLEHEKAKIDREEAEAAVERLKYTALSRLFPKMEDAARLVILKVFTKEECLVCGAHAAARRKELERLLSHGCCPSCGSPPDQQEQLVSSHDVEAARVRRARKRADLALAQEETARLNLRDSVTEYDQHVSAFAELTQSIDERRSRETRLRASLPSASGIVADLERTLSTMRRSQREAEAERAKAAAHHRTLLNSVESKIIQQAEHLAREFAAQVAAILSENAALVRIEGSAKLTQGQSGFAVPAFVAEMTAANRPGLTRRMNPDDVSESQRELMDLAFRLALIDAASKGGFATLVIDTPEASLDSLAMSRVGAGLSKFAKKGENRLVVTSNLTNEGMISAMFGGKAKSTAEGNRRKSRVLNLLELAAPNRAVEKDGKAYAEILYNAVLGGGG